MKRTNPSTWWELAERCAAAVDRGITLLAPQWGARRQVARRLQSLALRRLERAHERMGRGWDTPSDDRVRGSRWLASQLSPDAFLENNLQDLQDRSTDLYRKNTYAHAAVESRITNEVGIGITPQPRVGAFDPARNREINETITEVLRRWSETGVDQHRQLSLGGCQRLLARTYATYGEAFVLLGLEPHRGPLGLAVEVIAPERIETPPRHIATERVRLGIQYNARNRVVGYWVRDQHPYEEGVHAQTSYTYYPRFDEADQPRLLHVFDPLLPGQSRGIPWLAAAHSKLKDLDDWHEAELVAKQVEACFGLIFRQKENSPLSPQDLAEAARTETDTAGRRLEDLEPAMVHYAAPGEEVQVVDPSRPGATFAPFLEAGLRSIAAAANLPYELVAKNFARMNFSGGRLAMLDGRMGFRMRRQVLIEQALAPLYRRLIWEAVFQDELNGAVDLLDYTTRPWVYDRHKWQGQGWGYVDPQKEVAANAQAKDEGLATYAELIAEKGGDWEEEFAQQEREQAARIEMRVRLRALERDLEEQAGLEPEEPEEPPPAAPPPADDFEDRAEEYGDPVGSDIE